MDACSRQGRRPAGGEGFFEALPNPPGWLPFFAAPIRQDLPFLIEMRVR